MPAVQAPANILVTGASGFLALWVVRALLTRGYHVWGTVRTASTGEYMRRMFEATHPGRFTFVVVGDIQARGALDEAVKGMDGIIHIVSPVIFPASPDDGIKFNVESTLRVLESAKTRGLSIKRVVLTSSSVALVGDQQGPHVFTEKEWNTISMKEVNAKGTSAGGFHKYSAAKTLGERAMWDFLKQHKVTFDGVSILPPYMYGPVLGNISSIDDLNFTVKRAYDIISKGVPKGELSQYAGDWIDVRDVADAHVEGLAGEQLGGRRIITAAGPVAFQDFYDVLHGLPEGSLPVLPFTIPRGIPRAADETRGGFASYPREAEALLNRKFRTFPESLRDMLVSLKEKNLL